MNTAKVYVGLVGILGSVDLCAGAVSKVDANRFEGDVQVLGSLVALTFVK